MIISNLKVVDIMVLKRLFASIVILTIVINLILLYNKDRTENVIQQGYEMKKEDNLIISYGSNTN